MHWWNNTKAVLTQCWGKGQDDPAVSYFAGATLESGLRTRFLRLDGKAAHPRGEPHFHAWAAMLRVALEDPELAQVDRQAIQLHRNAATDPHEMSHAVYVWKIHKAQDRDQMKAHFSQHRDVEPALKAVMKGLVSHGAKQKVGQAPRAGLQSEVQEVIHELTAVLGDRSVGVFHLAQHIESVHSCRLWGCCG